MVKLVNYVTSLSACWYCFSASILNFVLCHYFALDVSCHCFEFLWHVVCGCAPGQNVGAALKAGVKASVQGVQSIFGLIRNKVATGTGGATKS